MRRRVAKIVPEHSPVASSQSNGYVERAIQSISGQTRTMLGALEARVGRAIRGVCTYTLSWIVECASVLWNRYAVSADGKTAYETFRSEKSRMFGLGFGEKVHWRHVVVTEHRTNNLDSVGAGGDIPRPQDFQWREHRGQQGWSVQDPNSLSSTIGGQMVFRSSPTLGRRAFGV